jgi:hypothetical protein
MKAEYLGCEVSFTYENAQERVTHLVVDQRSKRKEIEQVGEVPPYVRIAVLPQTLVVETVHLRDLSRLVVASQDGYTVSVSQLHGHEQGDGFDGVVPTIDIVAHEEVIGVRRVASDPE